MKPENTTVSPSKSLVIGIFTFLIASLGIMLMTTGIQSNKLLSQFSSANTTPATASSQWKASPNNPFASQISAYSSRVDGIIKATMNRGSHLNATKFQSYLLALSVGIVEMGKKPVYVNDTEVKNIVGYISYELDEAGKTFSAANSFLADYSSMIDGKDSENTNRSFSIFLTQGTTKIYPNSSMKFQLDPNGGTVQANWSANFASGCWLDYGYTKDAVAYSTTVNGGDFLPNTSSGTLTLVDKNGGKLYDVGLKCGESSVGYFNIPANQTKHYFIEWTQTGINSQTDTTQASSPTSVERSAAEAQIHVNQALLQSKFYKCYVEEKIWQQCGEYIKIFSWGPTTYQNPKNTGCTANYKADSDGWALVYLPKTDAYQLSGWGCAQGRREQYCRVGTRTEVSTATIEQETGLTGIQGTDIWSPSRVGLFTDRFTPSESASSCSKQTDGDLYWKQDLSESGGILLPEITITRTNDADGQSLAWQTTPNTEKVSWTCTGPNQQQLMSNRTIANENETLNRTNVHSTWKEFQTSGWSAGTWDCTWKITGNHVVNTRQESFTIEPTPLPPTDPNQGMFGMKPKFTFSRTCDGTPCTTISPGKTSYGANWTTENAQSISYTCTGPSDSQFINQEVSAPVNMSTNFSSYEAYINSGWTPGSYTCTWTIKGFDASATIFSDSFNISK